MHSSQSSLEAWLRAYAFTHEIVYVAPQFLLLEWSGILRRELEHL